MSRFERLLSTSSRRLGLAHVVLVLVALGTGILLAAALHLDAETNHIVTLRAHGLVMTMLVLVPAIPGVLGNLALPSHLGLRELPFVRLGWCAVGLHALAALAFVVSAQTGGLGVGVALHMAHSREIVSGGVAWTLVTVAFASAAVALQAVRVLTAVISARTGSALASGLGAGSALLIVGSPLALGLVAATLTERAIGVGVFDAALGGDPSLFAALVATITHVMTTASLVGALGVVGSVIEQHVTRRLGRTVGVLLWLVAAFGALGGGGELVSLDTGAASSLRVGFFDAIHHALLLALVVRLVGALREGADVRAVPLHFGLAALSMLAIALPAGIALSTPLLGPFLHGSVFATARTHYLAVGGVLLALLAGLHQCWPELVGAEARRDRAFWGLATLVVGVQLSFLPMLVLGIQGAPRPLPPTLAPGWMTVSFVGLVLVVVGLVTIAGNLLSAIREPADGTPSAS